MDDDKTPQNDPISTPKKDRPWYKKKKIVIPLVLLLLIIGAASSEDSEESGSTSENSATTGSPSTPNSLPPVEIEPAGGEFGDYPSEQIAFVRVIEKARDAIDAAETDLQESVALRARDKRLCSLLTGNRADNWTGIIKNVGANGEGKAYITIEIGDDARVQTWNNAFSEIGDNTLIPDTNPIFDVIVPLEKGDSVKFSAKFLKGRDTCLKQGNLTEFFYGRDPEFIVQFTKIEPSN
jgi:hypothetical protein